MSAFGFTGEHHFNRTFRDAFGRPPGRFRDGPNRRRNEARTHDDPATILSDRLCGLY